MVLLLVAVGLLLLLLLVSRVVGAEKA